MRLNNNFKKISSYFILVTMCCFEYCFTILFRTYSNESILSDENESILSDAPTVRNNYSITDENEKIIYYNNPLRENNYRK